MRALKTIALLIFCGAVPLALFIGLRWLPPSIGDTEPPSYAELVLIVLAAVTVVLAVLAIIIAILAVWGYQSIKNEASQLAQRAVAASVDETVKKHVGEDAIRAKIEKELKRTVESMLYSFAYAPQAPTE